LDTILKLLQIPETQEIEYKKGTIATFGFPSTPFYPKSFQNPTDDTVTNFIWPYLHPFFIDSHSLNGYRKPLKRPFDKYQSRLKVINNGRDIRQINW